MNRFSIRAFFLSIILPARFLSASGPDIIIGELHGNTDSPASQPLTWGTAAGYAGYSFGHTECNIGDIPVNGIISGAAPILHPVMHQALYRYSSVSGAGRFEMIGHSWPFHEYCFLQGNVCTTCTPYCCCDRLGVGCSSSHNANISGSRPGLGPKSQINAATGEILVWPHATAPTDDVTTGRVRAFVVDVDPALNPGATYYAEEQIVAQDDATAGNKNNNASYRRCVIGEGPAFAMSWFSTAADQTVRQSAAIKAWAESEAGVAFTEIDVPNDGRFTLGYKVTDLSGAGTGPWHYEYALHNLNSDRCAASFSVPMPDGVDVFDHEFHDVEYYKDGFNIGTAYDGTDWEILLTVSPPSGLNFGWGMLAATPFENSNALRWGTLYNFRFDADSPPVSGEITLGLFKPGTPASVQVSALVPSAIPCACPGDLNSSSTIDGDDIAPFVAIYTSQSQVSNCADLALPHTVPLDDADITAFVDLLISGTGSCN